MTKPLRAQFHEAVQSFETQTQAWPVWRRLVVFVPIVLVLSWLLVVAILAALAGLRHLTGH